MGSISTGYSIPIEAQKLFQDGILGNPLMANLPPDIQNLGALVHFEGNLTPSIPINWRLAESISALKAFEATLVNAILKRRYGVDAVQVTINTDHASLFVMSIPLARIRADDGSILPLSAMNPSTCKPYAADERPASESFHRMLATGIYRTRDDRFYHIHGSLNSDPTLTALGLPLEGEPEDTYDAAVARIRNKVREFDAPALDDLMNNQYRQAGTTVMSAEEYLATPHARANAKAGLYEIVRDAASSQPPSWWPSSSHNTNTSSSSPPRPSCRPLAGLKVVDLTRVIAGPTITRGLAELGASVMRITSPHVVDWPRAFHDLNWGKWNAFLHLKDEADREKLRGLIREADVVVDGYRPGVMERLGFGREDVFKLVRGRDRGIVHLRENCYGWRGPWAGRSGWQGISDACCGVASGFGRAMGLDEPVIPPFPNSDHCTGAIGCSGILHALIRRAEDGGSYGVDTALNYYSQWLICTCGSYPADVWEEVWKKNGRPVFRHWQNTRTTFPAMVNLFHEHSANVLLNPSFFEERRSEAVGTTFIRVKPIAQYADDAVQLTYNVGCRGNGLDEARWPGDLTVEIVRSDE
ncbi:CoA-transferase family III domain-containing protein [Nemania sp. FL0916]|nr:CoA-transferase family III domain-containing protein [Nemania sp. FL0916]